MPNDVVGLDACATKVVDEARVEAAKQRAETRKQWAAEAKPAP